MPRPKGSKNKTVRDDAKNAFERYWERALEPGTPEWRERQQRLLDRRLREQPLAQTLATIIKKIEDK
jgi:hypothetical protein